MNNYSFIFCDTETTGLDPIKNDIIELSIYRLYDNAQKTWLLKPINMDNIEIGALRVNGHKMEDLQHITKEGRERYVDPCKVIIEIENWLAEDGVPAENRCLIGQNISFDKSMLEQLWIKCGAKDSLPFGRRYMDTMVFELMMDYCKGELAEGYSLKNLTKKYGITNVKAHSAAADTLATKQVFDKQVDFLKKLLKKIDTTNGGLLVDA